MTYRKLTPALILAALPLAAQQAEYAHEKERPTYVGRAFLFQADLESGLELGWHDAATSRDEILETIGRSLGERVRRSSRFVEAVVTREDDATFAAIFVGRQPAPVEEMIIGGLSAAGRLSYHLLAENADLEACGSTLLEERGRLESWRSAHPGSPLPAFDRQAAEAGGPCRGISWRPRRESDAGDEPIAVLRSPSLLFRATEAVNTKIVAGGDGSLALRLELGDEGRERLDGFEAARSGRRIAFAVDGEVAATLDEPPRLGEALLLQGGFDLEEIRPLLLAFAGDPLPAPLRFVGRAERELPGVQFRDSPTTIK
jgi:hypothetical protein